MSHRVLLRPSYIWENLNMLTQKRAGVVLHWNNDNTWPRSSKNSNVMGGPLEQAWASLENSKRRKSPLLRRICGLWNTRSDEVTMPHLTLENYLSCQRIVIPICSHKWVCQMPFAKSDGILFQPIWETIKCYFISLSELHIYFTLAGNPEWFIIKCSYINLKKLVPIS